MSQLTLFRDYDTQGLELNPAGEVEATWRKTPYFPFNIHLCLLLVSEYHTEGFNFGTFYEKYATSIAAGLSVESIPKCWRRPKRKPCKGELDIDLDHTSGHISWCCEICGDEGVVSGWEGSIWDMLDADGKIH